MTSLASCRREVKVWLGWVPLPLLPRLLVRGSRCGIPRLCLSCSRSLLPLGLPPNPTLGQLSMLISHGHLAVPSRDAHWKRPVGMPINISRGDKR